MAELLSGWRVKWTRQPHPKSYRLDAWDQKVYWSCSLQWMMCVHHEWAWQNRCRLWQQVWPPSLEPGANAWALMFWKGLLVRCQHLFYRGAQDKRLELPRDCKLVPAYGSETKFFFKIVICIYVHTTTYLLHWAEYTSPVSPFSATNFSNDRSIVRECCMKPRTCTILGSDAVIQPDIADKPIWEKTISFEGLECSHGLHVEGFVSSTH